MTPRPKSSPSLAIKPNDSTRSCSCAVCGQPTAPQVGPELFLSGTWALVCHTCGERYAPALAGLCEVAL